MGLLGDAPVQTGAGCASTNAAACQSPACAVCDALRDNGGQYMAHSFKDPRRQALTCEAITDTLGYCAQHVTLFFGEASPVGAISAVLADALDRLCEFLANEAVYREHLQQIFFGADRACPACRFQGHIVAAATRKIERGCSDSPPQAERVKIADLCLGHFKNLYTGAPLPEREDLILHYRTAFADVLQPLLASLSVENAEFDGKATVSVSALEVLRMIAGSPALEGRIPAPDGACTANRLETAGGMSALSPAIHACPVCQEIETAAERWMDAMRLTVKLRQPLWMTFPTCPEHLWLAANAGGPAVATAAARHGAAVALASLTQRLWPFTVVPIREPKYPLRSWSHRRRRSAAGGRAGRKPTPRPPRCQGCECRALACDRAVIRLLTALQRSHHSDALTDAGGLCLKHFALVYLLTPGGTPRLALREMEIAKLSALRLRLDAAQRLCGDEHSLVGAVREAMRALSGQC